MKISEKLKQRFCKDMGISINIFESPVFEERLKLFDRYDEYKEFMSFVNHEFRSEEDFFDYYDRLKDNIIQDIKHSDAYRRLNGFNMTGESIYSFHDIRKGDVYREGNIGRTFISIDMPKANFSVMTALENMKESSPPSLLPMLWDLRAKPPIDYDYGKFMKKFTPYSYFAKSKYLRQVIFGNCNPKRQVYMEKHLISMLLRQMINGRVIKKDDIYSICSDEAVLRGDNVSMQRIADFLKPCPFPLKIEKFTLGKLKNTDAYLKTQREDITGPLPDQCKCVNPYEAPFIYRFLKDEPVQESDRLFVFNGKIAKLLETQDPDISLDLKASAPVKKETESEELEEDGISIF